MTRFEWSFGDRSLGITLFPAPRILLTLETVAQEFRMQSLVAIRREMLFREKSPRC